MAKVLKEIDDGIRTFIERQQMFFVGSAPLSADGHVNISPKALDAFRILSPTRVAYLDHIGSAAETIAHVRENRRIVIMFCAFHGPPKIVRMHGRGEILKPGDAGFVELRPLFGDAPPVRAIVVIHVERLSHSCGFGVPLYEYTGQRTQLIDWASRKGDEALLDYQAEKNLTSIDGLTAVDWVTRDR